MEAYSLFTLFSFKYSCSFFRMNGFGGIQHGSALETFSFDTTRRYNRQNGKLILSVPIDLEIIVSRDLSHNNICAPGISRKLPGSAWSYTRT
jgi:hypothetical protein